MIFAIGGINFTLTYCQFIASRTFYKLLTPGASVSLYMSVLATAGSNNKTVSH